MIREAGIDELDLIKHLLFKLNPSWTIIKWKEFFEFGLRVSGADYIGLVSVKNNLANGFIGVIPSEKFDFANIHSWVVDEGTGMLALQLLLKVRKRYSVLTNYSASPKPRQIFETLKWAKREVSWISYLTISRVNKNKSIDLEPTGFNENIFKLPYKNTTGYLFFKKSRTFSKILGLKIPRVVLKFVGSNDETLGVGRLKINPGEVNFGVKWGIVRLEFPIGYELNGKFLKMNSKIRQRKFYISKDDFDVLEPFRLLNGEFPLII